MNTQPRKPLVTLSLTIAEQDTLIALLRDNTYVSSSKKYKPEINQFLARFSRLVFNSEQDGNT